MSIDRLLSGQKWRCKICMHTESVKKGEDMGANISIMKGHVVKHKAIMVGYEEANRMDWQKFLEPVSDKENSIA